MEKKYGGKLKEIYNFDLLLNNPAQILFINTIGYSLIYEFLLKSTHKLSLTH